MFTLMEYFDAESRERDLPFRTDGDALANLSEQRAALACLRDVVLRCEFEDMRTPAVLSALDFLSVGLGAGGDHAVRCFRQALAIGHPHERVEALRYCLRSIEIVSEV
jgi:hypothetical protein